MTPTIDRGGAVGGAGRLSAELPWLALIGTGIASTLVLLTLPVFVGGIVAGAGWGDLERGLIAAADMAGSTIASLAVLGRMARFGWRRAARTGLLVAVAGNLACLLAGSFAALIALRLLCGLGCGVVLSIAFTGLCHARDAARHFGFYVLAQLALQALLLALLPAVIGVAGMPGVYLLFAACLATAGILTAYLPDGLPAATAAIATETVTATAAPGNRARLALAGQAAYFLAMAALWTYYEGIGTASGIGMERIGEALATSAVAGVAGAAAAILLSARTPPLPSLVVGTGLSLAAAMLLVGGTDVLRFAVSACLFNFAWNFSFPYQMGILARFDRTGSVAVTSLLVQLAGLALGPALAAVLLARSSYDTMLVACAAAFALGLALFAKVARP